MSYAYGDMSLRAVSLGLLLGLGACAGPSDAAASSESAQSAAPAAEPVFASVCSWRRGALDLPSTLPVADYALSPDGRTLVYTTCDTTPGGLTGRAMVRDLRAGTEQPLDDTQNIFHVRFTPDSKCVYYASYDRTADRTKLQPHLRSLDGAINRTIPLYRVPTANLAAHIEGFELRVIDQSVITWGYEKNGVLKTGALVVSDLKSGGTDTDLTTANMPAIGPYADVMASTDRVLLSTTQSVPNALTTWEVKLPSQGAAPTLTQNPSWLGMGTGSVVVPGSFTGIQVLRWDFTTSKLSVVGIDGISAALGNPSLAPRIDNDHVLADPASRGAMWVDGKPLYTTGTTLFLGDVGVAIDAKDQLPVGPGPVYAYLSTEGLSSTDFGPFKSVVLTSIDPLAIAATSPNGTKILVSTKVADGTTGFTVVDVKSEKSVALASPPGVLRPFGALTDEWATPTCTLDHASAIAVDDYGDVRMVASSSVTGPSCARTYVPPQVWYFDETGKLANKLAIHELEVPVQARGWVADPALETIKDDSRYVASACGFAGDTCTMKLVTAPVLHPPSPTPLPSPEADAGPSPDAGTPIPVRHPVTNGAETSEPSNAAAPETFNTNEGGCSSAPSPSSPSSVVALLFGLALVLRRRAKT